MINLGEENKNSAEDLKDHIAFLRKTDPYNHPLALHTFYDKLLGVPGLDIASIQVYNPIYTYNTIQEVLTSSRKTKQPWIAMLDENGLE